MISRRQFIKRSAITVVGTGAAIVAYPFISKQSKFSPDNIPNYYIGLRSPNDYIRGQPGDIYIREDSTNLYVHTGSTSNNTAWVAV